MYVKNIIKKGRVMNKKGFTLIEIMGVIVVISLIFLIAIPTILNKVKKGQDTIDESTQNMIISATKDYMSDNINDYPEEIGNVYCIDINDLIDKFRMYNNNEEDIFYSYPANSTPFWR